MLKTWINGASGGFVKKVIEDNFKVLGKYLPNNMLALSTNARNMLTSEHLSDGLIIFDTTLEKWMRYKNGQWSEYSFNITGDYYTLDINSSDWLGGKITIPSSEHKITEPTVEMFILYNNAYEPVIGGINIDTEGNITLSSDINFNGRVVIK